MILESLLFHWAPGAVISFKLPKTPVRSVLPAKWETA